MTGSMQRAHRERKGWVWKDGQVFGRGIVVNSGAKTKMKKSIKEAGPQESRAQLGKFQPVEHEVLFRL